MRHKTQKAISTAEEKLRRFVNAQPVETYWYYKRLGLKGYKAVRTLGFLTGTGLMK